MNIRGLEFPCGSEPARDDRLRDSDIHGDALIASKFAPTVVLGIHGGRHG